MIPPHFIFAQVVANVIKKGCDSLATIQGITGCMKEGAPF
jgi:hypothetical protein